MEWIEFVRSDESTWPDEYCRVIVCNQKDFGNWIVAKFDHLSLRWVSVYCMGFDLHKMNVTHYLIPDPPKASE